MPLIVKICLISWFLLGIRSRICELAVAFLKSSELTPCCTTRCFTLGKIVQSLCIIPFLCKWQMIPIFFSFFSLFDPISRIFHCPFAKAAQKSHYVSTFYNTEQRSVVRFADCRARMPTDFIFGHFGGEAFFWLLSRPWQLCHWWLHSQILLLLLYSWLKWVPLVARLVGSLTCGICGKNHISYKGCVWRLIYTESKESQSNWTWGYIITVRMWDNRRFSRHFSLIEY